MRTSKKFTSEHISALCQRGISILIAFALALNLTYKGVNLINGVSEPFSQSDLAHSIFSQRFLNFAITSTALCLQAIHLATQKGGFVTKMVIILLIVSLGVNLNISYTVKSLQSDEQNSKSDVANQNCLANYHKLWPINSVELYNQASQLNCTDGCPCIGQKLGVNTNTNEVSFQNCLLSEKAQRYHVSSEQSPAEFESNINQQFDQEINQSNTEQIHTLKSNQKMITIQKLQEIEEYLQCSGICDSKESYYFWDATKDIQLEQNNQSCYSRAVNQVQKDVLLPTKNQSITIIFIIIFLLIQEIFITKSSIIIQFAKQKLGACIVLPISKQANQQTTESKSNIQNQEADQNKKMIKIQLIDLTRKIIVPKNKDIKCSIKVNLSPKLLKTDDENQNSPNAQIPEMKLNQKQSESIEPTN